MKIKNCIIGGEKYKKQIRKKIKNIDNKIKMKVKKENWNSKK